MKIFIPGLFLSNLTPAKTGDPVRSILLKKSHGKSISKSLPTIFLERIIDLIIIISISVLGASLLVAKISTIFFWMILTIPIYVFLISFGIFIIISKHRTKKILLKLYSLFSFIPWIRNLRNKIDRFSIDLHKSFLKFKSRKILLTTFFYTLAIWVIEGLIFYVVFISLGLQITLISAVIIIPLATLIGVLSFLPGGLGSAEIIMVLFFTALFPLTTPQVTAAALLGRLLSFWTYAIIGAIILSTLKYKYKL
jgi:uncharacterized protein (TIRG00374 family)